MKKLLAGGAVAGLVLLGGGMAPATASEAAPDATQTCPAGDSGKIEVADGLKKLILEAPEGFTITKVCVKAGSAKQAAGGAEIVDYDPDGVSHSTYKDISHYSYWYEPEYPEYPEYPEVS